MIKKSWFGNTFKVTYIDRSAIKFYTDWDKNTLGYVERNNEFIEVTPRNWKQYKNNLCIYSYDQRGNFRLRKQRDELREQLRQIEREKSLKLYQEALNKLYIITEVQTFKNIKEIHSLTDKYIHFISDDNKSDIVLIENITLSNLEELNIRELRAKVSTGAWMSGRSGIGVLGDIHVGGTIKA